MYFKQTCYVCVSNGIARGVHWTCMISLEARVGLPISNVHVSLVQVCTLVNAWFCRGKHHQCNLHVMHTSHAVTPWHYLIAGKHHQRQLLRVKTILGTSIGAGCIIQMHGAQGQDPVRKCTLMQAEIGQSRCSRCWVNKTFTSNWRRTPQHLWRIRWMQDCWKSRSVDDSHSHTHSLLRSSAGRFPLLNYGLPKVHKPYSHVTHCVLYVPFLNELFKFLAQLLAPLFGLTSSHVWNSKAFVESMRSQIVAKVETLVSFIVVSLFSSVPTDLAIWVTHHSLESDTSLSEWTGFTVDYIMGLCPCFGCNLLVLQLKGVTPSTGYCNGFPVLVAAVNLMMEDIEERVLFNFHFPIYIGPSYLPVHHGCSTP